MLFTFLEIRPSRIDPTIMRMSFAIIMINQKFQNSNLPSILSSTPFTLLKKSAVFCNKNTMVLFKETNPFFNY